MQPEQIEMMERRGWAWNPVWNEFVPTMRALKGTAAIRRHMGLWQYRIGSETSPAITLEQAVDFAEAVLQGEVRESPIFRQMLVVKP